MSIKYGAILRLASKFNSFFVKNIFFFLSSLEFRFGNVFRQLISVHDKKGEERMGTRMTRIGANPHGFFLNLGLKSVPKKPKSALIGFNPRHPRSNSLSTFFVMY